MEYKLKGLVLSSVDSGEKDKIVTLLTDTLGKIKVKLKGVRSEKSKFKFVSQPFAFIDCVVVKKSNFYTLISAMSEHTFFNIMQDFDRMQAGFAVLEICDKICMYSRPTKLIVYALQALNHICYDASLQSSLAYFVKDVLILGGYDLQFDKCINCGKVIPENNLYAFDMMGGIKCVECFEDSDKSIKHSTRETLRYIFSNEYQIIDKDLRTIINLLVQIVEYHFSCNINSTKKIM